MRITPFAAQLSDIHSLRRASSPGPAANYKYCTKNYDIFFPDTNIVQRTTIYMIYCTLYYDILYKYCTKNYDIFFPVKYSFVRAFSSSVLMKCFIHPSLPPNDLHSFTLLKGYPGCQRFHFPFSQRELTPLKPVTLLLEVLRRSQIAASTLKNLSRVQGKNRSAV